MNIKNIIGLVLLSLVLTACGGNEEADSNSDNPENWTGDNIEFIVPMSEGGSVDALARWLASYWEYQIGIQMTVYSQLGESGLLGSSTFLETECDGLIFMVGLQPTLSINTFVQDADFSIDDF